MTIKKLFAFLFYFDKIDNFDNELQGALNSKLNSFTSFFELQYFSIKNYNIFQ